MSDVEKELADLNSMVREAHEALTDLRTEIKNIDARLAQAKIMQENFETVLDHFDEKVKHVIEMDVRKVLDDTASEQVAEFQLSFKDSIDGVQQAIFDRFDQMFNELVPTALSKGLGYQGLLPEHLKKS